MKVYLVQHGEAKREEDDPARPLSEKGLKDVKKIADYISKYIKIKRIYHSGKLRSKQTAEKLSEKLTVKKVEKVEGLEPLADPRIWVERLSGINEDIMLVGHLPHLSRLSSLLLSQDDKPEFIRFRNGGIVCLEKYTLNNWAISWIITPDIISSI